MDKRFVTFLLLTMLLFVGYLQLRLWLNPPPDPQEARQAEQLNEPEPLGQELTEGEEPADATEPPTDEDPDAAEPTPDEEPDAQPDEEPDAQPEQPSDVETAATRRRQRPQQWVTLGSVDPDSDYRMLLTFNNKGATLERAELSSPKYRDLEDKSGYFGHLALTNGKDGAIVNAVGEGTPAAEAECVSGGGEDGLRVGDVLLAVDGEPLNAGGGANFADHAERLLHASSPGDEITVEVRRGEGENAKTLKYTAELVHAHMQVIQPEHRSYLDPESPLQPLSYLTTLGAVGNVSKMEGSLDEIERIPSLFQANWQVLLDEEKPDEVAFKLELDANDLKDVPGAQPLEIIKRFRLAKADGQDEPYSPAYHVTMNVEVRNTGDEATTIALEQRGPTGLPLEGWWYVRKGSPDWGGAGMRDIVWRQVDGDNKLHRLPVIYDNVEDDKHTKLFVPDPMARNPVMRYVGVDSAYFSSVMMPDEDTASYTPDKFRYNYGEAIVTSEMLDDWKPTTGTSFRLLTEEQRIAAGDSFQQQFTVFIGPKDPNVLQLYGLEDTIIFGWEFFGHIARFLLVVLDWIHWVIPNYGIAIILLTVLVRMIVLPIGRKQAQNAAKMQELAPEMKAIAEKYKDMEQRAKAQQELFRRHNYHPLGGCWMMFLQLPIFFGLYKALSTSIDLRQASLIPGFDWCSNLAGPDMLLYWEPFMPAFLAAKNGWLGPYLNVLPLVTISLFIVQQKLFTPPATDEQQRMQQSMMKYMMIFMGFLFFKVPSGLCVYFIVSALWSVAERKLLPKPKPKGGPVAEKEEGGAAKKEGGKAAATKKQKPASRPKTKADLKQNSLAAMLSNMLPKPDEGNGKGDAPKKRPKRKKKRK